MHSLATRILYNYAWLQSHLTYVPYCVLYPINR